MIPVDLKIRPLQIGNLKLTNNLVMAPMAGITDVPFRLLAKENGAGLVCTEMLSSNALAYNDKKTFKMLELSGKEHPVSVQIFGANPEHLSRAAKVVEENGADIVDINFGCPVRKVVKTGAGSKMLENEVLMSEIMDKVVKSVKIPVTIKIRTGLTNKENVAPLVIKRAQECGISAVVVHGRTADVFHKGSPDLLAVKQAVDAAKIPVIGNGGIVDEETAQQFLTETGCAGLMIGRAAIETPDIFDRIKFYFEKGVCQDKPSWEQRTEFLKKHAALACEYYGEKLGLVRLRKLAPYYLKGLPNATKIRDGFNKISSIKELNILLSQVWKSSYFEELL